MYQKTASILRQQGLAPSRRLGQNFLVHAHTARRIAELAGVETDMTVIEVGVGLGALTRPLAALAGKVIGIEADSGIVRMHREQQDLPDNVELRHGDILRTDLAALAEETDGLLTIVSNLPYSISTPFLFHLIAFRERIKRAVIMVQKEVAERLLAQPGCKEYGAPTVLLAACATVQPLLRVGPGEFHPRPKVDSLVIRIDWAPLPERVQRMEPFDRRLFTHIVHAGFGQRRKTLRNALHCLGLTDTKEELDTLLRSSGVDPGTRAESLRLEEFVALSKTLAELSACSPGRTVPS